MIVDLDPGTERSGARGPLLTGLVIGALAIGLGVLVVRPAADPAQAARSRERIAAALAIPTVQPAPTLAVVRTPRPAGTPRPALPPALAPPLEVASALAADSHEASRAAVITVRDESRQLAYQIPDGRTFVVLQSRAGSSRPFLASYSLDYGTVRGQAAQLITTRSRTMRAMISWTEGPAAYLLYSGSLTLRDLTRLAEQLR